MWHFHIKQTIKAMLLLSFVGGGLFGFASFEVKTMAAEKAKDIEILPDKPWPHFPAITDQTKNIEATISEPAGTHTVAQLPPAGLKNYFVTSVVDGSTIIVDGSTRVRLAGIKSPDKDEEYGLEATDFLRAMIENQEILLMPDYLNREDDFGRLRAVIYFDRQNINTEMIRAGYAHEFPVEPSIISPGDWEVFETEAKQAKRGLWGGKKYYNGIAEEEKALPAL